MTLESEESIINFDDQIVEVNKLDIEKKLQNFIELLKTIENMDDKKKQLWREIYENAVIDRQNAFAMFYSLTKIVQDKSIEYGVHARSLSSFLERMAKSNDQLIKLAQLIAEEQRKSEEFNSVDIYNQFKK